MLDWMWVHCQYTKQSSKHGVGHGSALGSSNLLTIQWLHTNTRTFSLCSLCKLGGGFQHTKHTSIKQHPHNSQHPHVCSHPHGVRVEATPKLCCRHVHALRPVDGVLHAPHVLCGWPLAQALAWTTQRQQGRTMPNATTLRTSFVNNIKSRQGTQGKTAGASELVLGANIESTKQVELPFFQATRN